MKKILSFVFLAILVCSWIPYKHHASEYIVDKNSSEIQLQRQQEAAAHPLYNYIPRHREQIHWYDIGHWILWSLFGNDDDGIFGEFDKGGWKNKEPITPLLALQWNVRNPLHNFCFYLIGKANRGTNELVFIKASELGLETLTFHEHASTIFVSPQSSFFLGLHGGKPFFSLRFCYTEKYSFDFYIGWRERGNFGIKLHPLAHRKKVLDEENPH